MSKYAEQVARVLATAPRPTAEQLDIISSNLAMKNDPNATPASKRVGVVRDTPTDGNI